MKENISQLKSKMAANGRECEERNRQLREEREVMLAHFQVIKLFAMIYFMCLSARQFISKGNILSLPKKNLVCFKNSLLKG